MSQSPKQLKVLVADDHFLARQMIVNVLREKGVTNVHTVNEGRQARQMIDDANLAGKPFHMVFLDWEMPEITGVNLLKHFREQPQFNDTAFIMVTAVSDQREIMDAIKSGATAYLMKPVAPTAIAKKFDEIMLWLQKRAEQKG